MSAKLLLLILILLAGVVSHTYSKVYDKPFISLVEDAHDDNSECN